MERKGREDLTFWRRGRRKESSEESEEIEKRVSKCFYKRVPGKHSGEKGRRTGKILGREELD